MAQAKRSWTDADQALLYTCYLAVDRIVGRPMRPAPVAVPFPPAFQLKSGTWRPASSRSRSLTRPGMVHTSTTPASSLPPDESVSPRRLALPPHVP